MLHPIRLVLVPVLLSFYEMVELFKVFVVTLVHWIHLREFRERGGDLDLITEGKQEVLPLNRLKAFESISLVPRQP